MSPVKIGFIVSLLLHSLLAIAILINQDEISKISKQSNNTIAISLENINNNMENQPINQQKRHNKPKKQHKKPPKPQKIIQKQITKDTQEIQEETVIDKKDNVEEVTKDENKTEIDEEKPNDKQDLQDATASGMAQEIDTNSELYAEILRIINKYNQYPRDAYRRGITGSVEVQFVLKNNGDIQSVEVLNKIHRSLSEGAIRAINNAYKNFPKVDHNLRIKVKLTYNLT